MEETELTFVERLAAFLPIYRIEGTRILQKFLFVLDTTLAIVDPVARILLLRAPVEARSQRVDHGGRRERCERKKM
jgi:hypothetical protein